MPPDARGCREHNTEDPPSRSPDRTSWRDPRAPRPVARRTARVRGSSRLVRSTAPSTSVYPPDTATSEIRIWFMRRRVNPVSGCKVKCFVARPAALDDGLYTPPHASPGGSHRCCTDAECVWFGRWLRPGDGRPRRSEGCGGARLHVARRHRTAGPRCGLRREVTRALVLGSLVRGLQPGSFRSRAVGAAVSRPACSRRSRRP